VTSINKS